MNNFTYDIELFNKNCGNIRIFCLQKVLRYNSVDIVKKWEGKITTCSFFY